jgi:DNA-binding NtrC family response regulator
MAVQVAVINTSEDTLRVVQQWLELEGLTTVGGYVTDFRQGRASLRAFLTEHDPQVIIWDLAIPYAENWAYWLQVRDLPEMDSRRFVITTTNERAISELVGTIPVYEIVGKPFDLDRLAAVVRQGLGLA